MKLLTLDDGLSLNKTGSKDLYREYINPELSGLFEMLDMHKNFVRAEGTVVWDDEGNEYLDFTAGFGSLNLGHNHPAIRQAVERVKDAPVVLPQSLSRLAAVLAHNLAQITPGDLKNCFFCNSATESIEAALKLARAATGRQRIVYCDGAFHGKTLGALSVSGSQFYRQPFVPLLPECQKIPYGDTVALEMVLRDERAACFIVEPIQVESGIVVPVEGYLQKVREICKRYGTLLIVDESQTAFGRCGEMFTCELDEVVPDILCLSGFLGGGVMPVSGLITTSNIWQSAYGTIERCQLHTSIFGDNTTGMAAGIAALNEAVDLELSVQASEKGSYLIQKIEELVGDSGLIKEVRGKGLLIGIELNPLSDSTREKLAAEYNNRLGDEFLSSVVTGDLLNRHHIICTYTLNAPNVIRVQPPLTVSVDQLDRFAECFADTLKTKISETTTASPEPVPASFIVIAHDDASAPWGFLHEGQSMGISVEIFSELAKHQNITVKYIGATWANIFPLLVNKQVDLILNAGWPNAVFDEYPVIASEPYARFEAHIFMKRDPSDPRVTFRLEDIKGKRVGIQRAGIAAASLKQAGAEVIEYDNDTLSFLDHFWNKTDCVSAEKMVGISLNQSFFQGCFQVVSEPIVKLDVVCLAHKDNAELIDKINKEIISLRSTPFMEEVFQKYSKYSGPRRMDSRIRAVKTQ